MQKTPDQIYDEVEARWAVAKLQKKTKLRNRTWEVAGLAVPFAAFIYWAFSAKLNPIGFAVATLYFGFAVSELMKRWSLEDRIEMLERK